MTCNCLQTNELLYTKCDLNTTNLELFLINLGLPMYIELFKSNSINLNNLCFKSQEQLALLGITDLTHLNIIFCALKDLKRLVLVNK